MKLARGNFKGRFQSRNRSFRLRLVRGVNTAKHAGFFHALAGLGDSVHAHVVIDGGILREPPAAEIADDFANDARVAFGNLAGFC